MFKELYENLEEALNDNSKEHKLSPLMRLYLILVWLRKYET
jgi:hypothetical protein